VTAPDRPPRGLVLLAEDNAINQLVALDTLAVLGYRADLARDGTQAVEMACRRPYQAILMDCEMPGLDGYAATGELRRREGAARHTPVIALTAGTLDEDRRRCLDAGMDDYLTKPLDPAALDAALDRTALFSPGR
jgi:CheY-like chemotaxis protein